MQKGLSMKDEEDTTPVGVRVSKTKSQKNTIGPLCLLSLSVHFFVFVQEIFLRNPKKLGHFSMNEGCICDNK